MFSRDVCARRLRLIESELIIISILLMRNNNGRTSEFDAKRFINELQSVIIKSYDRNEKTKEPIASGTELLNEFICLRLIRFGCSEANFQFIVDRRVSRIVERFNGAVLLAAPFYARDTHETHIESRQFGFHFSNNRFFTSLTTIFGLETDGFSFVRISDLSRWRSYSR